MLAMVVAGMVMFGGACAGSATPRTAGRVARRLPSSAGPTSPSAPPASAASEDIGPAARAPAPARPARGTGQRFPDDPAYHDDPAPAPTFDGFDVDPGPTTRYVLADFPSLGDQRMWVVFGKGWRITGSGLAWFLPAAPASSVPLPVGIVFGGGAAPGVWDALSIRNDGTPALTVELRTGERLAVYQASAGAQAPPSAVDDDPSGGQWDETGWTRIGDAIAQVPGDAPLGWSSPGYGLATIPLPWDRRLLVTVGGAQVASSALPLRLKGWCTSCQTPPDRENLNADQQARASGGG